MRYSIYIAHPWQMLFALFGFSAAKCYVDVDAETLSIRFGSAHTQIPLSEITAVTHYAWPWYYGLGSKFGPHGGVAYVGSQQGVLRIDFAPPRPIQIWGPFRRTQARCIIISLEHAESFLTDIQILLSTE